MTKAEVVRILRKKSTNRYYIVNCETSEMRNISRTGAEAVCKVFDVEVEPFDAVAGRK